MSSNLMDTEPGGETPQYESIQTVTNPHSKQTGQLGDSSSTTHSQAPYTSAPTQSTASDAQERGQKTTENIKYGQTISENQGGAAEGSANAQGGYGGMEMMGGKPEGVMEGGDEAAKERRDAGYGGAQDMNREIGG